jgi:hypothetical protein
MRAGKRAARRKVQKHIDVTKACTLLFGVLGLLRFFGVLGCAGSPGQKKLAPKFIFHDFVLAPHPNIYISAK